MIVAEAWDRLSVRCASRTFRWQTSSLTRWQDRNSVNNFIHLASCQRNVLSANWFVQRKRPVTVLCLRLWMRHWCRIGTMWNEAGAGRKELVCGRGAAPHDDVNDGYWARSQKHETASATTSQRPTHCLLLLLLQALQLQRQRMTIMIMMMMMLTLMLDCSLETRSNGCWWRAADVTWLLQHPFTGRRRVTPFYVDSRCTQDWRLFKQLKLRCRRSLTTLDNARLRRWCSDVHLTQYRWHSRRNQQL